MQKSWICGTKHADITPISIVGMIDTHNRWNQVFVVWPSYVSVQNKFVWVWLPQMDANMLHVRFVRPWWDSTAWTVEYSRIQFMHWYSWCDITPWHFSAARLVGEGHRHHRSIYKECVNQLWTVTFVPTEYQASRNIVWLCIVLSFDHSQTTRFHTKKWCDQKKKQWKVTPPCQTIHVLVPAPIENM